MKSAPRIAANSSFARELLLDMEARAAEAGLDIAGRVGSLTPRELRLAFRAEAARSDIRLREMDTLAWLCGQYVAVAVHAPRKYPKKSSCVRERTRADTDEGMRRIMEELAGGAPR